MNDLIRTINAEAEKETLMDVSDEEYVDIGDHAGGNIDDAYSMGIRDGRIEFARELAKMVDK